MSATNTAVEFKDVFQLLLSFYSLHQQRSLHQTEIELAKKRHDFSIKKSEQLATKSLSEVKRFYLLELFNNLEQHFQQLNADLIASCKEAERDMFDQRNQSLQTIILSASVMFGALSTAIVNGTLADDTEEAVIWVFGVASAISFGALFISIVLCIETVIRASLFMYRRAQIHTKHLQEAIDGTKRIMFDMRKKTADSFDAEKLRKISEMSAEELEEEWKQHEEQIHRYIKHRAAINHRFAEFRKDKNSAILRKDNIPILNNNGVNDPDGIGGGGGGGGGGGVWEAGEEAIVDEDHSHKRVSLFSEVLACLCCCFIRYNQITPSAFIITPSTSSTSIPQMKYTWSLWASCRHRYTDDVTDMTFNGFWEAKCQIYATWAFGLFYLGTVTLLVAISLYLYSKFRYQYDIFAAAIGSAVVIGVVVIAGLYLAGRLRSETRNFNLSLEREEQRVTSEQLQEENETNPYRTDLETGMNINIYHED